MRLPSAGAFRARNVRHEYKSKPRCRLARPSSPNSPRGLTFSAHGSPLVSSEALIGVAVGFCTGGRFGFLGWLVSGGGSLSHATVAAAGAAAADGPCAQPVPPT